MCLSWYLDSHYNMYFGAMRKVCLPVADGKIPKLSWRHGETVFKWRGKWGIFIVPRAPDFFILPHHVIKKEHQQTPFFSPSFIPFPFSHLVFSIFFPLLHWKTSGLSPLYCFSVQRVADKRNCANEPLKSLNGCGLCTKGQRMQRWTKTGPCPTTPPCSDGSERTHERGLDLRLPRRHLAPHWAEQKGRASGIHWNPSQVPQNNHDLLTSLTIHRPWLIWETHACFSIQHPPSLFIILKAWNYSPFQSKCYRLDVGSH